MIEVSISGVAELRAKLDKLEKSLDVVEILDEAEAILLNRIRARFLAETDPDGNPWVPSRAGMRRRARGSTGTLFKTGTLFHSIQAHATGPNERSIGTDVSYGPQHQLGLFGNLARPFLGFGEEDLYITERRVVQRIAEAIA